MAYLCIQKAANELQRYVKREDSSEEEAARMRLTPNYTNRTVFSADQENALEEYLIIYSKMSYGLERLTAGN